MRRPLRSKLTVTRPMGRLKSWLRRTVEFLREVRCRVGQGFLGDHVALKVEVGSSCVAHDMELTVLHSLEQADGEGEGTLSRPPRSFPCFLNKGAVSPAHVGRRDSASTQLDSAKATCASKV